LNYLITPRDYGFFIAVDLLTYNIVGGIGIWYGPILGAVMLTALPEVLRGVGVTAGPQAASASMKIRLAIKRVLRKVFFIFSFPCGYDLGQSNYSTATITLEALMTA